MSKYIINNLISDSNIEIKPENEIFEDLINEKSFRIEKITSTGQHTPEGIWLEEQTNEFVLVIQGSAGLKFFDDPKIYDLHNGEWCIISKFTKHRVEYTDNLTIWLTVHYE
ncbi:MAG: hypothetical protein ABFD00_00305 [Chloroherpetonaceae bacterium]|nr:hypothetical protein [bacterium]